jgi:peptidoglycan/LPS O-acetylase OafA/YrhL
MVVDGAADATAAGFGAIWSLSIEEQFYLVWPLLVASLSTSALRRLCLGVVILSLPLRALLAASGVDDMTLYHATFTRVDALAVGALVAIGSRNKGVTYMKPFMAAMTIVAAIAASLMVLAASRNSQIGNALRFAGVASALATGWGAVLVITLTSSGRWTSWMESASLRFFGKHSYAIYLLQAPVDHLLGARLRPEVIGWVGYAAVATLLTTMLAVASWHLWEQPFLSLRRFVPRARESAPMAIPAP